MKSASYISIIFFLINSFSPLISSMVSNTNVIINKMKFPGLISNSFAHPLDMAIRKQISSLPLIESITRQAVSFVEEGLIIDNLSRGILVGPKQMPEIYEILKSSCSILDISVVPDVFIQQNPIPNAYTLAVQGRKPFIVIHSSLLDLLSLSELESVIAHELGHIKCEHGLWITALNIISLSLDQFGGGLGKLLSPVVENVLKRWQRSAEYTCDRAALLVSQDWRIVASTFLKLSGGSSSYSKSLDVDAFLEQSQLYEKAIKTRTGSMISSTMEQGATHPIPIFRVKELKEWSDGPQYKGILSRGINKK